MSLQIRKTLAIVCEGSITEPNYFQGIVNTIKAKELDYTIHIRPKPSLEEFEEDKGQLNAPQKRERRKLKADFHPRYLIQNIRYFLNKKSGEPILDNSRTNLFSRRLFFKPIDFEIDHTEGIISKSFDKMGIHSFKAAAGWVSALDYRRNTDKNNPLCIFIDNGGTCSTKHALLKRLADENGHTELQLMLGIFNMNGKNTPAIKNVLKKYGLKYIPEAHNYFRAYNYILDYTGIGINETKFELELLYEVEIQADQISDFKVSYHQDYLTTWIAQNGVSYSLDELWTIREECIQAIIQRSAKDQ